MLRQKPPLKTSAGEAGKDQPARGRCGVWTVDGVTVDGSKRAGAIRIFFVLQVTVSSPVSP